MEFLLPEEAAPITSRGNCTPSPSPSLTSPTHPLTKPREPPLPSSPFSTLYLCHRLPHPLLTPTFSPTPYILISSRTYWCPCAVVSRWFIENWKTDDCQSSLLPPRRNHKTCNSILLHGKFSPSTVYYQRYSIYTYIKRTQKRIMQLVVNFSQNKKYFERNLDINYRKCERIIGA